MGSINIFQLKLSFSFMLFHTLFLVLLKWHLPQFLLWFLFFHRFCRCHLNIYRLTTTINNVKHFSLFSPTILMHTWWQLLFDEMTYRSKCPFFTLFSVCSLFCFLSSHYLVLPIFVMRKELVVVLRFVSLFAKNVWK